MKISVIGAGRVGATIAQALLMRKLADELVLIDIAEDMVKGEALDLRQGQSGLGTNVKITGSTDYSLAASSGIIVITAGVGRKPGDSRLDLAKKNTNIMKGIIDKIKENENSILLIVSNPVDVMTYLVLKKSGFDNRNRIFGLGTTLDTIRLRSLLSEEFDINASSLETFIIGEHGDSMLPVFSHLGEEFEKERLFKVFDAAKDGAAEVIKLKGATTFAPAIAVAEVVDSIANDRGNILPTSTYHEDLDVCIGFPSKVARSGAYPIEFELNEEEREKFLKSVEIIKGEIKKQQES
jgi:malate/lactate dehydrogenase